ncbi:hypothetical protein AeMF1_015175 [Aphanomyces euteiches]|nr:hypothetical protein AeMF1_015175 [Aphanomyces euteiches]KAH9185439.1 hypothetical protein AeNC1_012585 [Aphanomyces euteiches]
MAGHETKDRGLTRGTASTTKDVVLPEGSILNALKRALRAHGEDQAPKPKDCDVTLSTSPDGSLEIALSVVVFDVLKAAYEFHLDELAVPELVVLAAKVVDLEDEVQELKRIIASMQEQLSAKKRKIRDERLSMAAAPPSLVHFHLVMSAQCSRWRATMAQLEDVVIFVESTLRQATPPMALVQFAPNMTQMSLQLAHVVFPSQRDDIFRVEIKSTADNMPILIWQLVVVNMNDHSTTAGDIVLPCYFILSTLKRALTANSGATPADDCDVDVLVEDGKMKLVLHLQEFAGLKAEYSYLLDDVELAETAILEAKIDDLEMKFTKLQAKDSEIAALQNDMELLKALVGKNMAPPQRRHGFADLDTAAAAETFSPKLKGEKKHKRS